MERFSSRRATTTRLKCHLAIRKDPSSSITADGVLKKLYISRSGLICSLELQVDPDLIMELKEIVEDKFSEVFLVLPDRHKCLGRYLTDENGVIQVRTDCVNVLAVVGLLIPCF